MCHMFAGKECKEWDIYSAIKRKDRVFPRYIFLLLMQSFFDQELEGCSRDKTRLFTNILLKRLHTYDVRFTTCAE